MNKCWHCGATEDISVHSTTKAGTVRYICRAYRREKARKYAKNSRQTFKKDKPDIVVIQDNPFTLNELANNWEEDWEAAAHASYQRILNKYAKERV